MKRRDAVIVLLSSMAAGCSVEAGAKELSAKELEKLLEKPENLFFLDVREPQEVKTLGSVKGYVNIPLGQLQSRLSEIPKNKLVVTL